MTNTRRTWASWVGALGLSLALSCATSGTQKAGGTPPNDPRGVPVGGTSAAYHPQGQPNFYFATSLGVPGSGAFAGSGPGEFEHHQEEVTGQPAPKAIPQIPAPVVVAPVVAPPLLIAPEAAPTPVEAPPVVPAPPEQPGPLAPSSPPSD
jgi:hypothetical protein